MASQRADAPPPPRPPEDHQHSELLKTLAYAEYAAMEAIASLDDGASETREQLTRSLDSIRALQANIERGAAGAIGLASLGNAVAMACAIARSAASSGRATEGQSLADAIGRAGSQASTFMRDVRQYDHLLTFADDDEGTAYREREAERRRRYDAESAKGTPEGQLNAAGAALGQMTDLAVHGGSRDPALMRRLDDLVDATTKLRAQLIAEGRDVSAFDERTREDLRAIMRSKRIAGAQIDALLDAHRDNPIEAMRAFAIEQGKEITERDVEALGTKLKRSDALLTASIEGGVVEALSVASTTDRTRSLAEAIADMHSLNLAVADHDTANDPTHGVTAQVGVTPAPSRAL